MKTLIREIIFRFNALNMMENVRRMRPPNSNLRSEVQRRDNNRSLPPLDSGMMALDSYDSPSHGQNAPSRHNDLFLSSFTSAVGSGKASAASRSNTYPAEIVSLKPVKLPPLVSPSSRDIVVGHSSVNRNETLGKKDLVKAKMAGPKDDDHIVGRNGKRKKKKRTFDHNVPWDKINSFQDRNVDENFVIGNRRSLPPNKIHVPAVTVHGNSIEHRPNRQKRGGFLTDSPDISTKNGNVQLRYKESLPPIGARVKDVGARRHHGNKTPFMSKGGVSPEVAKRSARVRYEKGFRKDDLYCAKDLDFRPYSEKQREWNDRKLDRYLREPKGKRRNATCEMLDRERKTGLVQFCEDIAILNAIQQCF
ncbi:uncharacterized protein [Ptychodera flava]|uniref:uncharacterized protein n=1 Tax=Ptychodera flava TaxID=63121 RepID=UPI00396A119F